ncbi:MAG: serine/threonine-protein phosphatase [Acidobacteria bacterium]|nr:serine/threonine-protein phosphatase [Acidobacteriota bacterium]
MPGEATAFTIACAQHIGQRHQQQDAYAFITPPDPGYAEHRGQLAIVADGMGGMAFGDLAARCAVQVFRQSYSGTEQGDALSDALLRSLESANAAVCELAQQLAASGLMGTTLIATALRRDQLFWISAGDSGIFLVRDQTLMQLNIPHTLGRELDTQAAEGLISRQQAEEHPEREALVSFLGVEKVPLIDRNPQPLALLPSDVVLLASDGLFRTLSEQNIIAAAQGDAAAICRALIQRTLDAANPYQDNVTVLAVASRGTRGRKRRWPWRQRQGRR